MSSDQTTPSNGTSDELSDQELDEVAGGLNLHIKVARFQQTNLSFGQKTNLGSGCGSTETAFEAQNIESAALTISITDATTEDLQILSGLLGAEAIEGSS